MKCKNCNHPIKLWAVYADKSRSYIHKGNTTGDLCFKGGCNCDNPEKKKVKP